MCVLQSKAEQEGEIDLLYKYMYKEVVNRDALCAALSHALCLFLFFSSNVIKNNNCQPDLCLSSNVGC